MRLNGQHLARWRCKLVLLTYFFALARAMFFVFTIRSPGSCDPVCLDDLFRLELAFDLLACPKGFGVLLGGGQIKPGMHFDQVFLDTTAFTIHDGTVNPNNS